MIMSCIVESLFVFVDSGKDSPTKVEDPTDAEDSDPKTKEDPKKDEDFKSKMLKMVLDNNRRRWKRFLEITRAGAAVFQKKTNWIKKIKGSKLWSWTSSKT